jgi:hypothetical protein
MKNALFFLLFSVISLGANAQCVPDPAQTSPGIYPDSATGFSNACVDIYYEQLITNVVPADTNIFVFGIPVTTSIDSIVIDSVAGIPPGMNFECNPLGCSFIGGETGCATITGICSFSGDYPLVFYLSAYVGGVTSPNPFVVDYYSISVGIDLCLGSTPTMEPSAFKLSPNPTGTTAILEGLQNRPGVYMVSLMNMEGTTLQQVPIKGNDTTTIDVAFVTSGIYFLQIFYSTGVEVVKLVKD